MKYYKDIKEYKGSITLGPNTKVAKIAKTTIKVYCEKKRKEYILLQPDSTQVSFAEQKKKGYCSFIDDWIREMNGVIDYLKQKSITQHVAEESKVEHLDKPNDNDSDNSL